MEQLLLHLLGDYVTQTQWMATQKLKDEFPAFVHAVVYTIPFGLLTDSFWALYVIFVTHFVIDRFRLARYVCFAKNWITDPSLTWKDCSGTGYPSSVPAWMSVWLLIIVDNLMHLSINFFSLKYL